MSERDDLVAWWIAKYGREVQQIDAAKAGKQAADRRMRQWFEDVRRPLDRNAAWWQSLIDGYAWDRLQAECGDRDMTDPKVWKHLTKRYKFPTGYVQFRRISESYTVTDSSAWTSWVLAQAGQASALTAMWEGLSTWFGDDASTMVSLSVPCPSWADARFEAVAQGRVIEVATGEIVPGLGWEPASIALNKPHPEDVEHPAWSPPPDGTDLEWVEPPDDWQPDNMESSDLFD